MKTILDKLRSSGSMSQNIFTPFPPYFQFSLGFKKSIIFSSTKNCSQLSFSHLIQENYVLFWDHFGWRSDYIVIIKRRKDYIVIMRTAEGTILLP